jgi:hypothetical protein
MNKRNLTIIGFLAVVAIIIGGVGFAIADDSKEVTTRICDGTGLLGLVNGRGFWAQLTEEQRTELAQRIQEMIEAGATHEEIREMKETMMQEWGIDAPLWRGPHFGEEKGGFGRQSRNGSGNGQQFSGHRNRGKGYNGYCPKTN